MRVTRSLGEKALDQGSLIATLNKIVMPTLKELLRNFNALSYERDFVNSNVGSRSGITTPTTVEDWLLVTHNLDADIVAVTVRDGNGYLRALPDLSVLMTSPDVLYIYFPDPLVGTWHVLVQRG